MAKCRQHEIKLAPRPRGCHLLTREVRLGLSGILRLAATPGRAAGKLLA